MTQHSDSLRIEPIAHAGGSIALPGSKSISNRVLLLSALADGTSSISNLLAADDTSVMLKALAQLGVLTERVGDELRVRGAGGQFPVKHAELVLGNAGTAVRTLTAALALSGGTYRLDGVARMRERPIGDLVDTLNALGARISYQGAPGFPPLLIEPFKASTVDTIDIRGDVSSQFLTGLLMAAPMIAAAVGLRIRVAGELISKPYVAMTLALMRRYGVEVEELEGEYMVPAGRYLAVERIQIEGDASSATYFLALGAIAGGPVRVQGLGADSVQGDIGFAAVLRSMGATVSVGENFVEASAPAHGARLRAIDADFNHIPDAAMTVAVLALFADGPSTLRNIASWRVKETDRIAAMARELEKVGATVESGDSWLRVTPPQKWLSAEIETYDDHRMAMCFSLVAAAGVPVTILDPDCVAKTFPDYFDRLRSLVSPSTALV